MMRKFAPTFLLLMLIILALLLPPTLFTGAQGDDPMPCYDVQIDGKWYHFCGIEITNTPTPILTSRPTSTPTPVATDTPAPTLIPTFEPTPEQGCYGENTSPLNVREAPGGLLLGSMAADTRFIVVAKQTHTGAVWYQHYGLGESRIGWSHGNWIELEQSDSCGKINDLTPVTLRGVHFLTGANCGLYLNHALEYGNIKGLNGNEDCIKLVEEIYPDTFSVWRNWVRVDYGAGDGPACWGEGNPIQCADNWWRVEYNTWSKSGLIGVVDLFEYRNELQFVGAWEIAFDLRFLEHATNAGICLGVFSDGYGNPTLAQFNERTPVLDYMLETECQPGRYHMIAAHSYSRYDSGMWLFERWRLQRIYWEDRHGPKYNAIDWIFTEFGLPNTEGDYGGRGTPDCVRSREELPIIDAIFAEHPEIAGYQIFGWGNLPPWFDWSQCF